MKRSCAALALFPVALITWRTTGCGSKALPNLPPTASLSCNPPILRPAEPVQLLVTASSAGGASLTYAWKASPQFPFIGSGSIVQADTHGLSPGVYNATVQVRDNLGGIATASCQFTISPDAAHAENIRESRYYLLQHGSPEPGGYGLYSYVLLSPKPAAGSEDEARFTAILGATLGLRAAPEPKSGASPGTHSGPGRPPKSAEPKPNELNLTMIPVTRPLSANPTASDALGAYDWDVAEQKNQIINGARTFHGAYLYSSLIPLQQGAKPTLLSQDLSLIQPEMALTAFDIFQSETAKENFWDKNTMHRLVASWKGRIDDAGKQINATQAVLASWLPILKGEK
jgi:hypothetical protein